MIEPETSTHRRDTYAPTSDSGDPPSKKAVPRVVFARGTPELQALPLTPRERLIEAGWAEADNLPLAKAFAGVTTGSVAERAGVTTGSFFHHFHNSAEFADAMALAHAVPDEQTQFGRPPATLTEPSEFVDLVESIRIGLADTWRNATASEVTQARLRYEMRLWSFHNSLLSESSESFKTVGEIIGRNYRIRQREAAEVWIGALSRSGRELIHPFDVATVATVITALYEGLILRHAVDPDAVAPGLFSDVSAALVNYFTGPAGLKATFDEHSMQLSRIDPGTPQARSGARRRRETWMRIVAAASGLFHDGWENVSATEIADRAGLSPQTVLNLFHSVRRVAAATFVTHANDLYEYSIDTVHEDPMEGLRETVAALSQRTAVAPEAARALLAERIEAGLHRGNSMGDLDIRIEVPIGAAIGLWVGRLGVRGDRGTSISAAMANFVLATTLTGGIDTAEIVSMAIRLLPPEVSQGAPTSPVVT